MNGATPFVHGLLMGFGASGVVALIAAFLGARDIEAFIGMGGFVFFALLGGVIGMMLA